MKQLTLSLLAMTLLFSFGCGSKEAEAPPLDESTRAAIAEEDAAVAAEESQQ